MGIVEWVRKLNNVAGSCCLRGLFLSNGLGAVEVVLNGDDSQWGDEDFWV